MQKSIRSGESTIHYTIEGSGKTVVLIHGFAEDSNIFQFQAKALAHEFHVILPDIPGSGSSSVIAQAEPSIDFYADIILQILKTENIEEAFIIGHSMGGYIALAFAEHYPDKLTGLGLFHSTAFADDEDKIKTRRKGIEFIKENGVKAYLKTSIPGLFSAKTKEERPELVEKTISDAEYFTPEALVQYQLAMISRPDRTALLKSINKPVLFIIGEEDNAVPMASSLKQCYLPSVSFIHIIENTGHMGMLEEPEKTTQLLLDFCSKAN